jgi:catalase
MTNRHNDHTRHNDQRQDQQRPPASVVVAGEIMRTAYVAHKDDNNFVQPGTRYRTVMTPTDREHLMSNVVTHLSQGVPHTIQERAVRDYWSKVDADLGAHIGRGLGIEAPQLTGARA